MEREPLEVLRQEILLARTFRNSGFLFLKGSAVNGIGSGDVSSSFSIRTDDFDFQQGHWYGD